MKIRILARLNRVENGNFGDFKQISPSLFELRFFLAQVSGFTTPSRTSRWSFSWLVVTSPARKKDIEKVAGLLKELED